MSRTFIAATITLAASLSPTLLAQWPRQIVSTVPRTADGKVNLDAPTPKTADGKPDLSGVWETVPCRGCGVPVISGLGSAPPPGRGGAPAPPPTPAPNPGANVFGNIGGQTPGRRALSAVGGRAGEEAHGGQQQGQSRRALPADGHHAARLASVSRGRSSRRLRSS